MILIAGDSWGCGEWNNMVIQHGGLAEYLRKDNNVVNLSSSGLSFNQTLLLMETFFNSGATQLLTEKIKTVLVFKTEWHRDFRISFSPKEVPKEYMFNNFTPDTACSNYRRFYSECSRLASANSVRIGIIGGVADVENNKNFENEYPGVFVACQSVTNLCVNNNPQCDNPTIGIYSQALAKHIKSATSSANSSLVNTWLIEQMQLSISRLQTWHNHPQMFSPDGAHPNRHAHRILYEFLSDTVNFK